MFKENFDGCLIGSLPFARRVDRCVQCYCKSSVRLWNLSAAKASSSNTTILVLVLPRAKAHGDVTQRKYVKLYCIPRRSSLYACRGSLSKWMCEHMC